MTAPVLPPDAWAPVSKRWRAVEAGDVVLDPGGRPWMVDAIVRAPSPDRVAHRVHRIERTDDLVNDPDATVAVLVPLAERDAVRARSGSTIVRHDVRTTTNTTPWVDVTDPDQEPTA